MEQMKQQNKKPVVVGIGELLWDLLPTGKTAGGAPINFVYHASRLGAEGYAISEMCIRDRLWLRYYIPLLK